MSRWSKEANGVMFTLSNGLDHQVTIKLTSPAVSIEATQSRPSLTANQCPLETLWVQARRKLPVSSSRATSGEPQKSRDGSTLEIAYLIDPATHQSRPRPAHELSRHGTVGFRVAMAALDHEAPVEVGEGRVVGASDIGRLVEGEPEHGRAFFRDRP